VVSPTRRPDGAHRFNSKSVSELSIRIYRRDDALPELAKAPTHPSRNVNNAANASNEAAIAAASASPPPLP